MTTFGRNYNVIKHVHDTLARIPFLSCNYTTLHIIGKANESVILPTKQNLFRTNTLQYSFGIQLHTLSSIWMNKIG